jgi:histidyl-tRNA synthetase
VLGGGRYDGLIENLGGPPTPAVGWAAGIERLAMLLESDAATSSLDVIIAVENDGALAAAMSVLADLRRAGLAADMIATGSPRKRFDKATKVDAKSILSATITDGVVRFGQRGAQETVEQVSKLLPRDASEAKW